MTFWLRTLLLLFLLFWLRSCGKNVPFVVVSMRLKNLCDYVKTVYEQR